MHKNQWPRIAITKIVISHLVPILQKIDVLEHNERRLNNVAGSSI